MQLLRDLDAFYLEHRRCGDLETGVEEGEIPRIWMSCTCGARIERPAGNESEQSP